MDKKSVGIRFEGVVCDFPKKGGKYSQLCEYGVVDGCKETLKIIKTHGYEIILVSTAFLFHKNAVLIKEWLERNHLDEYIDKLIESPDIIPAEVPIIEPKNRRVIINNDFAVNDICDRYRKFWRRVIKICKHEYEEIVPHQRYEYLDYSGIIVIVHTYICKKCGKTKKRKFMKTIRPPFYW